MPITEGGKFSPEDRIVSPGVFTRENDLSGKTTVYPNPASDNFFVKSSERLLHFEYSKRY